MEILPGIHHFNTDPFNWYVLKEGNRLTLVDAGFPGANDSQARRALDRLREMGRVTVLPGHGKPWTGQMADAVKLARETA